MLKKTKEIESGRSKIFFTMLMLYLNQLLEEYSHEKDVFQIRQKISKIKSALLSVYIVLYTYTVRIWIRIRYW
jgi:hypothetical protein